VISKLTGFDFLGRNPTQMPLDNGHCLENARHSRTRTNPTLSFLPKATTENVFDPIHGRKLKCNVAARRLVITEDGAHAEDRIEALEDLCGVADWGSKANSVGDNVRQEVDLHLLYDARGVGVTERIQNIANQYSEIVLVLALSSKCVI
jgi:hypothetical protein